jgi:hypothetical protein
MVFQISRMALEDANIELDPTDRNRGPRFDLLEQPFYVLGIDPAATDLEVNGAIAVRRYGALDSEPRLLTACEAILCPERRLSSELSYPLDSRPPEIAAVYDALLSNASVRECLSIADKLAPLSRANFCAHVAARQPADRTVLDAIVASHAAISGTEVYELLKTFRTSAKWAPPSLSSVVQGLQELLDLHAEAVISKYNNIEDAAEPVLACTQATLASGGRHQIEVLQRFLAAYRKAIEIKRSGAAILIKKASVALQQRPEEVRLVAVLSSALQFWRLLCRPLILLNAHQNHLDDADLQAPADCVLSLLDDLERRHYHTTAHQIAKLGRSALGFPGEGLVVSRIEGRASDSPIKRLRDLMGQIEADPSILGEDRDCSGTDIPAGRPADRLWEAFAEAAHTDERGAAGEPWTLLRDLAMRLSGNQHHEEAVALLRGMIKQGQGIATPPEILATLPYDLVLIESQKRAQPAASRAEASGCLEAIARTTPKPVTLKPAPGRRRLLKGLRLAGAALAGLAVYFGFGQMPAPRWQVSPNPILNGANAPGEEAIPPVGTGQRYSLPYVRYCQFQQERLKIIKELAKSPEEVRAYNLLVVDYNARCSDFLYLQQDLVTAVAEVTANKSRIETEATRIVSGWPGHEGH